LGGGVVRDLGLIEEPHREGTQLDASRGR
jgi:hypothetical protein